MKSSSLARVETVIIPSGRCSSDLRLNTPIGIIGYQAPGLPQRDYVILYYCMYITLQATKAKIQKSVRMDLNIEYRVLMV